MDKVTEKQINMTAKELHSFAKSTRRKLFEFETIMSAYEIKNGKANVFGSAKELIRNAR